MSEDERVIGAAQSGWELFGPGADLDAVEARLDSHRESDRDRDDRHERRRDQRDR